MSLDAPDNAPRLEKEMQSDVELLEPLVEEAEAFLSAHVHDEDLVYRAVLLLSEAATNAMKHGNGFDVNKKVRVEVVALAAHVFIRVCDEGEGFNPENNRDPLELENLLQASGRGIFLIQEMADDVRFDDSGRCVTMRLDA